MELLQLIYFKEVAEKGKIVTAAEALFITPPALSTTISRLEKELNVKLFERTSNSITLNRQGKIFLRYTNQILSSIDNAKLELMQSLQDSQSHIHLAVTTSNLWIQLLFAFSQEYPHITLSNTSLKLSQVPTGNLSPRYSFLLAEEHDLDSHKYESLPLIEGDQPVLVLNPSHPLARKEAIDLREIPNETFFLPVEGMSMHRMAKELLSLAGISANNTYEYSYMLRRQMVLSGSGVSFSTVYTSKAEDPALVYIPIDVPVFHQNHELLWDKDRILTQDEECFKRFAAEYFNMQKS